MLLEGFGSENISTMAFFGCIAVFALTFIVLHYFRNKLPRDGGREFAHQGELSLGKPRGAGIVFVLAFAVVALLMVGKSIEMLIYIVLTAAAMLTGYLDDCAEIPWDEYKKGGLDLIIAIIATVTYIRCNGTTIMVELLNWEWTVPPILFGLAAVILIWVSINVTNCTDGVDGLLGTLSLVTLGTIYLIGKEVGMANDFSLLILLLVSGIVAYLWFNCTPSILMMGDAGSRAIGFFIALATLMTGRPFLYLLTALVLICDGGAGLAKIALKRIFKISILKNIRTPIHDHVRKNKDWSNTHTVYRFVIVQALLCAIAYWLVIA